MDPRTHWWNVRRHAQPGQILVLTALVLIMVFGLVGAGVDYGLVLVEDTGMQNAVDAASLAGARGLVAAPTPGVAAAQSTATENLRLHGYQNGVNNTTVTYAFTTPTPSGQTDTVTIDVARTKNTIFWNLFGIHQVTVNGHAKAEAGRGLFDVILSVDETASMTAADITQLQQAAQAFVNQLKLNNSDPRSSKVGIAQFQGRYCPTDSVWTWGSNAYGQLGIGAAGSSNVPVIALLTGVTDIAAGGEHSLARLRTGGVMAWGHNDHGQLGTGTNSDSNVPVQVQTSAGNLTSVSGITAGLSHSEATRSAGTAPRLRSWGANTSGQLGDGTTTDRNLATTLSSPGSNAGEIQAGGNHTLARVGSTLYAWGSNTSGQLGDGTTTDRSSPVSIGSLTMSTNQNTSAAGGSHSLAIVSSGTNRVRAWGLNSSGQLGDGTTTTPRTSPVTVTLGASGNVVTAVAAGGAHSLALRQNGTVWAWGSDTYGQLGDDTTLANKTSPVQVSGLSNITAIAAGTDFSLALDSSGNVWGWGRNDNGQLGLGNTTSPQPVPVQIASLTNINAIAAGGSHSMALGAGPCSLDAHVLAELSADPTPISHIIGGSAAGCPAMPAQPPLFWPTATGGSPTAYGCPIKAVGGSGTYEVSGIRVTFIPSTWDLWSTLKGGRTDAKKVLVLMTDGANNVTAMPVATADTNSVAAANATKLGSDQIANSPVPIPDDIEIYTVGFYDAGESGLISGATPLCPANSLPSGRTSTDDMMIGVSSSRPGTCDHYYPLAKTSSLPNVFIAIAGAITRSQLLQ